MSRMVRGGALAIALLAAPPAALAQDDAAPLVASLPAPPADPCAAIHRTSPEFLSEFAGMPERIVAGDDEDAIAQAFRAPAAKPSSRPAAERILASGMLPTGHTTFDAQWRRVRDSALEPRCAALLLGAAPVAPRSLVVAAVNRWVNRNVRYVRERNDHWADAAATLRDRRGDCEDLAVAKLQLLAALGVPLQDLYLTLVHDLVRRGDHAVLVVRTDQGLAMLDSATDRLLDARESHDYRPILSYSRERKWLHGASTPPTLRSAPMAAPRAVSARSAPRRTP